MNQSGSEKRKAEHKISEAIRIGCKSVPEQGFGSFCEGYEGAACAVGTAVIAELGIRPRSFATEIHVLWSEIMGTDDIGCPEHGCVQIGSVLGTAFHLNDFHRWTREQIADWLESLGF